MKNIIIIGVLALSCFNIGFSQNTLMTKLDTLIKEVGGTYMVKTKPHISVIDLRDKRPSKELVQIIEKLTTAKKNLGFSNSSAAKEQIFSAINKLGQLSKYEDWQVTIIVNYPVRDELVKNLHGLIKEINEPRTTPTYSDSIGEDKNTKLNESGQAKETRDSSTIIPPTLELVPMINNRLKDLESKTRKPQEKIDIIRKIEHLVLAYSRQTPSDSVFQEGVLKKLEVIRTSVSRQEIIPNMIVEELSVFSNLLEHLGPSVQKNIAEQGLTIPSILRFTISCRDSICENITIKLVVGEPTGGKIKVDATFGVGVYVTEVSEQVIDLFLSDIILPFLEKKQIAVDKISMDITGSADGHPVAEGGIPYKGEVGRISPIYYHNNDNNKTNLFFLRRNQIYTNTELAFMRAYCAKKLINKIWPRMNSVKLHTITFTAKDEGHRAVQLMVHINGVNKELLEELEVVGQQNLIKILQKLHLMSYKYQPTQP